MVIKEQTFYLNYNEKLEVCYTGTIPYDENEEWKTIGYLTIWNIEGDFKVSYNIWEE